MTEDVMTKYGDIIDLPHHVSAKRGHMSLYDRAAQFSPFAALTGYGDAIAEEDRQTTGRIVDEEKLDSLNEKIHYLMETLSSGHNMDDIETEVIYFIPDERKDGGSYDSIRGKLKRIDEIRRKMIFSDGSAVSFDDIYDINIISNQ